MDNLLTLAEKLEAGEVRSVELVEAALAAIADPQGEGERAFVLVDKDGARQAADQADG